MRTVTGRRLLLAEVGRQRGPLVRLAGWTVLEALPPLLSGQLVAQALDRGFVAGRPEIGVGYLLLLCACYVVASQATRRCYPAVATIVESLRDVLLRRVVDATLRRATAGGLPDLAAVARMTGQLETVRDVTAGVLLVVRRVAVTISAAVIGLLSLDPVIVLLVAPPLVLAVVGFGLLVTVLVRRQRHMVLADERLAASAGPVVENVRDVVACGAERYVRTTVGADIDAQFRATIRLARASALRVPILACGVYVPVILILTAAPSLRANGMSVGVLLGAIVYVTTNLESALRSLVQTVGNSGLRLSVALRRLAETSTVDTQLTVVAGAAPCGHDLELERVTFAYGPHAEPVIRDLSLSVPAGEHLAVVGPSGIGKSTLANLLAGVEIPQSGEIRVGGVPVAELGEAALLATVVLIPQEAYVFAGTLWENLTYLRQDATPDEVDTVVTLFGLKRLGGTHVELVPTVLSAGERQLVALARAYLSVAPVVVLDEATCHLDPVTEAAAEEAFAARPGTLVVIAHRITSARRARHILLMGDTEVRHGTHASLLDASALYRDLVGLWDGDRGSSEAPAASPTSTRQTTVTTRNPPGNNSK
ncbi:ATP-binding cassette subfamily C protein [Actinocrispum wychmicini]|uniref:ATP-binding cassette subfamily C protein n=1 Tax=Actinocrispum wychmicini TaxID=1213861 RepID=A0A4R2JKL9_9PSEU|nr:ATP-binding cassette subfamily C protein [Actinocrispum wychmicini]